VKIELWLQHAEIGFGILAGLVFGKPLGIMMAALIAVKTGIARVPQAVNWGSLFGHGFLAGIGFTVSLFIAMLAFDDMALVYAAERGIIAGSLLAGIAGAVILRAGRSLRHVN
jgi:Na+:H+ antiporter, NhaA family